jgi:hypothetical protein
MGIRRNLYEYKKTVRRSIRNSNGEAQELATRKYTSRSKNKSKKKETKTSNCMASRD